jgi:hypothetical protein
VVLLGQLIVRQSKRQRRRKRLELYVRRANERVIAWEMADRGIERATLGRISARPQPTQKG